MLRVRGRHSVRFPRIASWLLLLEFYDDTQLDQNKDFRLLRVLWKVETMTAGGIVHQHL